MGERYHTLNTKAVLEALMSSSEGLTQREAGRRLEKYGANEIEKRKSITSLNVAFKTVPLGSLDWVKILLVPSP